MSETRWWKYVQGVAGDTQAKDIADHVGIDKSNVTRWKQGGKPAVDFVLKFARAYGRPVVEALADAEYITDAEAAVREVKVGADELSDVELARELLVRAEARAAERPATQHDIDDVDHVETPDIASLRLAAKTGERKADREPWAE